MEICFNYCFVYYSFEQKITKESWQNAFYDENLRFTIQGVEFTEFYEIMSMIKVVRKAPDAASSGWRTHGFGLYFKEDDDYD